MTKRNMLMSALTAVTITAMAATGASADLYTPTSESMTDPKISTAQDGLTAGLYTSNLISVAVANGDYAYARPTKLNLPFHVKVEGTADKWRIKQSYIIIGIAPIRSGDVGHYVWGVCCGELLHFEDADYATLLGYGNAKKIDDDAWWSADVGDNSIGVRARNACRNLRQKLSNEGMHYDEIFSQDRSTDLETEFRFVARVAHRNPGHDINESGEFDVFWKQSQSYWTKIGVRCEKKGTSHVVGDPNPDPTPNPTGSDDIAMGFQVNQAALAITPKPYAGKCPAKLHLNPTIEATGKGTVKYRFVDQLGNKSQEFQVKFDKHDVKFPDHIVEIDDKGKAKGLGFATPQAQGGGLGYAAPTVPHLNQGYFQVEVTSPHHKLSNIADYSVKCTVQTAGDGKIVAPKDTVNPVVVGDLAAGLPDLVIDSVQPSPAVPTKLFVKITNKGIGASKPTNLKAIRWTGNQSTARGTAVPAIQAGQSQVVLAELGGTINGATQLYVRVDDPNRIPEKDEGNNSFKVK